MAARYAGTMKRRVASLLPLVGLGWFVACSSSSPPAPGTPSDDAAAPSSSTAPTASVPPTSVPDAATDASVLDAADAAEPPVPKQIGITTGVSVDGYFSDVFSWIDAAGKARTAAIVRNDRGDPSGYAGGYLRKLTYEKPDGTAMVVRGGRADHPGWGYTINHLRGTGDLWSSLYQGGTSRRVLAGPHHVVHELAFDARGWPGGPVTIVIHWFFATGHDHPLWSVTFDLTRAAPDAVDADDRSPYGDLTFENGTNGTVDGVGWGDRYKFTTTSAGPVSNASAWDYTAANRVPYVRMWNDASDSEMGNVQSTDFASKDAGGTWFYNNWGRTSANKVVGSGAPASQSMPISWNWPFQLNQYELDFGETRSKRMAWGMRRGAVGATQYWGYGDQRQLSGYPYQSHSNYLVLGAKSAGAVAARVSEVEASLDTTLAASVGAVRVAGPEGIARTTPAPYAFPGFDPVYGVFAFDADASSSLVATLTPTGAPLHAPILTVHGYGAARAPDTIVVDGVSLAAHRDFYPTLDKATRTLWLTVDREITGATTIEVRPPT